MNLNIFFKDPRYEAVRSVFVIVLVITVGIFAAMFARPRQDGLRGMVNPADTLPLDIELTSIEGAQKVEKGLYGVHMAKLLDEVGTQDGWLDDFEGVYEELEPEYSRFFAGGEVSYYHFKTTYIENGRVNAQESSHLLNGNEIRGNGFILKDREDEEANGNSGEISELTSPKPRYGNLSYLDGFQNVQPRNIIRDYVDMLKAGGTDSMFVLNLRYSSPQEELEKITFLKQNGINIVGIECGNEAYAKTHPWHYSNNASLSVDTYLNKCDDYRDLILASYPGIPFAVSVAPKKNFEEGAEFEDSDFNSQWNIQLAQKMGLHGYENYVLHFYAPFNSCQDMIQSGADRESIFDCGLEEMRDMKNTQAGAYGTTRIPVLLGWYKDNFPGYKMWMTEWNINQDPANGTDAKYANSILHAAFVQNVMNMLNEENAQNSNFIKFANLHTLATDGGNAMINRRVSKGGVTEPEDLGAYFVRRTPYFAYLSMKDIYKGDYYTMNETVTSPQAFSNLDDISIYAYKDSSGKILLSISNLTGKTLTINSVTVDGKVMDLSSSDGDVYSIQGDAVYSSKGSTEFSVSPGHEIDESDISYGSISSLYFGSYAVGRIEINPEYQEENPTQEDCGLFSQIFGCGNNAGGENKPPKVSLTNPVDKTILTGENILIESKATDSSGISVVEFYASPIGKIGEDTTEPYSMIWNTSLLQKGVYRIQAKAIDTEGKSALSETVSVVKK